jgi:hypothetical protein
MKISKQKETAFAITESFKMLVDENISLRKQLKNAQSEREIESLKDDAIVMANARRLIKAKVATSNGRLYMEIFGTGMGSGRQGARGLGLDCDGNNTSLNEMLKHIEKLRNQAAQLDKIKKA